MGLVNAATARKPEAVSVSATDANDSTVESTWLRDLPSVGLPPIPVPHISRSRTAVKAPFALRDTLQATVEASPSPLQKRWSRKGRRKQECGLHRSGRAGASPPDESELHSA